MTSTVPWMIYAMPQLANVLARTVLQMINAANALKVSLDIQIVKVKPRTFIYFLSVIPSYARMIEILTIYTSLTNNQLQHKLKFHKAKLLQLKLIHIFASAILLMKKLEIEKTKPTFIYQF